eukprot:scaffold43089_cov50-Attheya_sp.AAC.5
MGVGFVHSVDDSAGDCSGMVSLVRIGSFSSGVVVVVVVVVIWLEDAGGSGAVFSSFSSFS